MSIEDFYERTDRACDALALAFDPNESLGRNFYVPCAANCERAFGHALRKLFGEKQGSVHWCDLVMWNLVRDMDRLEPRILRATKDVLVSDADSASIFDMYFITNQFQGDFYYGKGTVYRFVDAKREEALDNFNIYWDLKEQAQWKEIHEHMRVFIRREFDGKS